MDPVIAWLLQHPELNGDSAFRKLMDASLRGIKMPAEVRATLKRLNAFVSKAVR